MQHIVVGNRDATLIEQSKTMVQVRNLAGRVIGYVTPAPSDAELAKWRQRLAIDEPTYTTAQVLAHLRSLPTE